MHCTSKTRRQLLSTLALGATWPASQAVAQTAGGQVVLYSSNNAQSVETVTDVARKAMPGVRVNAITGGSGQLLRRMQAEAAKPLADVFWTSSANVMGAFRPLFEPYKSREAAAVPAALHDPEGLWTGANIHVVVAMINLRRLGANPPLTWADMTAPQYKGKIIIADPANSSTAYTALWGADTLLGAEGLKKLAANVTVSSNAANVARSVGQGEYAVGLTFESTAYPYVAGGQKEIRLIYPKDGTFVVADSMALVKGAPNPAHAKRMYDVLLSKEMQIGLLQNAFRRPSRSDIDVSTYVDMPALSGIKVTPMDDNKAAAGRDAFLARWQGYVAAGRGG